MERSLGFLVLVIFVVTGCDQSRESVTSSVSQNLSRENVTQKSVKLGPRLVDARDKNSYATVQVAGKTWMAENLRFDTVVNKLTWCPGGDTAKCRKYGRLYSWQIATRANSDINFMCDVSLPERGICPVGWHLPAKDEWQALIDSLGGSSFAGRTLKEDSLWLKRITGKPGTGSDSVGFSALPAGYRFTGDQGYGFYGHTNQDSSYFDFGARAFFWSRTNTTSGSCWSAWGMSMSKDYDATELLSVPRSTGLSVRCVQD